MDYTNIAVQTTITIGLAEVYKRLGLPKRFIPLVDLFLGLIISIITGLSTGKTIINCVMDGLIVGLSACGLYSGVKNTVEE